MYAQQFQEKLMSPQASSTLFLRENQEAAILVVLSQKLSANDCTSWLGTHNP